MLDSSPVALPSRRPLKRSASTASLPTPPRTHRKHASGRSRGSCDSDSDDRVMDSSDEEGEAINTRKKRRLDLTGADAAANEDAFWLGGTTSSAGLKQPVQDTPQVLEGPSTSKRDLPLLYKRKLAQQQQEQRTELVAPVSPPPSHRRVVKALPLPSTPPRTRAAGKRAAVPCDSPENPFLDTPQGDDEIVESPPDSSANPSPRTPDRAEKPIVYMVFRGMRKAYPNRLYDHKNNRPLLPPEQSKLDINDPEYEPSEFCTPKVLFPDARRKRRNAPRAAKKRAISPDPSGDEGEGLGEGLDLDIKPKKLDFGRPKQQPKANASLEKNRKTLEEEFKNVGAGFSA
ncbi:hypothetical protein D9619_011350 [Psilocybe cf. subviscida]|uniref:Uncharacterized protein n=1 Tax=Psilocybe cf. subviscida TaxID=2480587 RepID=A0A8H5F5J9_9AGAR|nr:hypothetical protein D9619_011350 [Psilocybe cf. subviscida]